MKSLVFALTLGCASAQAAQPLDGYPTQQDAFYRTQDSIYAERQASTDRAAAARRARAAETDAWLEQYAADHKIEMLEERIRKLERERD